MEITEADRLRSQLEAARRQIEKVGTKGAGGVERAYGDIYQQLVRLGAAPQIKYRYRAI